MQREVTIHMKMIVVAHSCEQEGDDQGLSLRKGSLVQAIKIKLFHLHIDIILPRAECLHMALSSSIFSVNKENSGMLEDKSETNNYMYGLN